MSDPRPPAPPLAGVKPDYLESWPRYMQNGKITRSYMEFQSDLALCYSLVKIGSHLVGRPLKLITGGPRSKPPIVRAATDGTNIFLPKTHPNRVTVTKHELAHIVFQSDIALRLAFVQGMVDQLEEDNGVKLAPHVKVQLVDDLCFLINILDDLRVNSLWSLTYPGDGQDLEFWYEGIVGPSISRKVHRESRGDVSHLFTYMNLLCLHQDAESSQWGWVRGLVAEARDAVLWTTFPACLLICKKLCLAVISKLVSEDDEPEEPQAVARAAAKMSSGRRPSDDATKSDQAGFDIHNSIPLSEVKNPKIQAKVRRLLKVDVDDVEEFEELIESFEDAGHDLVREVKRKLSERSADVQIDDFERWSTKWVKADVKLSRIAASELRATSMTREDIKTIRTWHSEFAQIVAAKRMGLSHVGHQLDVSSLLMSRVTGVPMPTFIEERLGRGFEVLFSVDMSTSMEDIFPEVERLCVVTRKAMDFPFTTIHQQGWTSTVAGQVRIFQYPPCHGYEGLVSPISKVGGVTPLPHAIQVGGRVLSSSRNERHLIVLSDGLPIYFLKNDKRRQGVQTEVLMDWTRSAVEEARRQNINVWCWMIGSHTPQRDAMDFMFGPGNWRKINEDSVYEDVSTFLRDKFFNYLRRR